MTGFAQVAFTSAGERQPDQARRPRRRLELAAQEFKKPQYFHERPSATTPAYNAGATTFANLGPTNPDLAKDVNARSAGDPEAGAPVQPRSHDRRIPVDAVTTCGSGIDPDISPAYARCRRDGSPRSATYRWQRSSS